MTLEDQFGDGKQDKVVDQALDQTTNQSTGTRQLENTDYEEGQPKWGSAHFKRQLVLDVLETNQSFSIDGKDIREIVLGRKDPQSDDKPDIDLTASEAAEKGVSRRHATIMNLDGALYVVDNNSSNGTFLNGQRLVAHQRRVLRDGDDVRLGHLVVRVTFR